MLAPVVPRALKVVLPSAGIWPSISSRLTAPGPCSAQRETRRSRPWQTGPGEALRLAGRRAVQRHVPIAVEILGATGIAGCRRERHFLLQALNPRLGKRGEDAIRKSCEMVLVGPSVPMPSAAFQCASAAAQGSARGAACGAAGATVTDTGPFR